MEIIMAIIKASLSVHWLLNLIAIHEENSFLFFFAAELAVSRICLFIGERVDLDNTFDIFLVLLRYIPSIQFIFPVYLTKRSMVELILYS
jgi:hypothetical protein